ncbi:MAG TPA: methyltransferase domain-containing protein [Candidatus Methylomirabilis sp.]|nr:methyltransferase domain-containing protein [Candidatus Methylomirabilis sp.]
MIGIEIARRNYLLYLLLPHRTKMMLLTEDSRRKLDGINRETNEAIYSGEAATSYDRAHRYGEAEQHEFPTRILVGETWAAEGYGRALEVGAGTGYFTALIARRARSVLALEPAPDMQKMLRARCEAEGLTNVDVMGASVEALSSRASPASFDSALLIHSLHHLHRRPELFDTLGRVVRPGGRLLMVEPHHNLRRAARLLRHYLKTYRARAFWTDERNWGTHDFITRGEIRALCRRGGFDQVRIRGHWFPYARRMVADPVARFRVETALARVPGLRHFAAVLAVEARRR